MRFGWSNPAMRAVLWQALILGAKVLYSEDLQHGQRIGISLRIENPFRA